MDYFEEDLYKTDDKGLNGYDRMALEFVTAVLEKLQRGARVYGLSGQDVMTLQQTLIVVADFLNVDYDGFVRITASREDGLGVRSSDLEITPDKILIGVSGFDSREAGGEPYSDVYFVIGNGDESDSLSDDLTVWEEEFFDKLTRPETKLQIEGEVMNIDSLSDDNDTEGDEGDLDEDLEDDDLLS
jgi:hypothetical protein